MKKIFTLVICIFISIYTFAVNFSYAPANNITLSSNLINFKWNDISRTPRYKLNISLSPSLSPLIISDSLIVSSSSNATLTPNTYYWQVFADTGLGFNLNSSIYKFTIVSPTLYDSLAFWVKAEDIIPGLGDTVSVWPDNSPNNFTATQTLSTRKPTLKYNALNGYPTVSFDGSDLMASGNVNLNINGQYSSFVIAKTSDMTAVLNRTLFSKGNTSSQGNVMLYVSTTNKIASNIDLETRTGTTTISNTKYYLYSTNTNLDSSNLYINKTLELKYIPTVDLVGTTTSPFQIGGSIGTALWKGNISEVLLYKRRLTNIEQSNIENYLMDKYAPPINLGKDLTVCGSQLLTAKNNDSYASYLWNTGSTDSAIVVTTSGVYSIRVTDVFNRISYDTINVLVDNIAYTGLRLNDTVLCIGSVLNINAGPAYYSYLWSDGDTSNIKTFSTSGTFWVRLTDCPGNIIRDTFTITLQNLSFNLGNDTTIIPGQSVYLQALIRSGVSYLWNTGATSSSINATTSGVYWCSVFDPISGCTYIDTINITVLGVGFNFIYAPANNSTLATNTITFLWNHIPSKLKYKILIATNPSLSPILISDSTITGNSFLQTLSPNSYYWQVIADTGTGFNIYSSIFKFSTIDINNIDSLSLWLKADNIIPGTADSVLLWEDNSLNNYDASQTITSSVPFLERNSLNHLPSVKFDGVDDLLSCGNVNLNINLQYSFFILSKTEDFLISRSMFSKGVNGTPGNVSMRTSTLAKSNTIIDGEQKFGLLTLTPNRYYLYDCTAGTDSVILSINNNSDIKYAPAVDLIGSSALAFQVGAANSNNYWKGNIAELLIFKRKVSATEKTSIQNYLMDKYAPPVNLGPDITTCQGTNVLLSAKNDGSYVSYLWNTGSTDSAINTTSSGVYSVRVVDIFNRFSYDTVLVKFDNTNYTSFVMRDTAVCLGTSITLSAGQPHLHYLWSTGDTTSEVNFTAGGTYWVNFTDCQSNVFRDTFNLLEVDIRFNLGNDTLLCLGNSIVLNPSATRPVSYLWNTGATTPTLNANTDELYWCRLRDNALGCFSSDSINIDIDSFNVKVGFGLDTSMCNGNSITVATGADLIQSILWNTLDTTILTLATTTGDYSFLAFDSVGCSKRDTINIRIRGNAPFVDFLVSNICAGDTLKPINLSSTLAPDVLSSFSWNFGDGQTDTVFSPIHYFDSTGIYTVQLIATSDSGCSNFSNHIVSYSEKPIARINSLIACANSNVILSDASIIPVGYTISSWNWNVNGTTSTAPSIIYNFPSAGKYPLSLTVITSGACSDTYSDSFEVFPAMNINFDASGLCYGDTTKINDVTGSFSIIQREWIFGAGLGYAFNTTNPRFIFPSPGSYMVSFKAKNAIGCVDSIARYIRIYNAPTAYFTDSIACLNSIKTFTDRSTFIDDTINHWNWTIDTNHYSTPNVNHISNSALNYTANLEVETVHGCKDSYNRMITISTPPIADYTYTPNYGVAPLPVFFTNTSSGASSYIWYFNDSTSATSTSNSPSFTFLSNNDYWVTLEATSNDGCVDSMTKIISIKPSDLDIQVDDLKLYETLTPSGFIETKIGVRLSNVGSRIINNAKLLARIENGNIISEDWTGTLLPGQRQTYLFNAAFLIQNTDINRYICVEAYEVNDNSETILSNNKDCVNNHSQGVCSEIYPNPANTQANFDVVLVQATPISYTINNEFGQVISATQTIDGLEGLNHFVINTNNLSSGHYYVQIKYFTSEEKRKFQISR
ncbi:MAG: PKD domain-containing protein [Bacteroidota bacterium]